MAKTPLLSYILEARLRGMTDSQIRENLKKAEWEEKKIEATFAEATQIQNELKKEELPVPHPSKGLDVNMDIHLDATQFSASKILLYIGVLIMIIAGVTYISINWTQWGPVARILAICIPMCVSYAIGAMMWNKKDQHSASRAFVLVGGLLFPLFVSITFRQLHLFSGPESNEFICTMSIVIFFAYFISSVVTKMALWSPLTQIAGFTAYYFFLRILGVPHLYESTLMSWLVLLLGGGYFGLSLLYANTSERQRAVYTSAVSALITAVAVTSLFVQAQNGIDLGVLIVLGIGYILIGISLERGTYKDYCGIPYLFGFGLLLIGLYRFPAVFVYPATQGVRDYGSYGSYNLLQRQVLWYSAGIGVIYILLSYLFDALRKYNLKDFTVVVTLLHLIGPLVLLHSVFSLGLGASRIFEETLLLVLSLAFIFGSIPRKIQQYLVVGTLFLIVYIFSIGGEYFQNQVGWPITLFITGLLAMGISVGIEKIRRNYFKK